MDGTWIKSVDCAQPWLAGQRSTTEYAVRGSNGILQSAPFEAGHRDTWAAFLCLDTCHLVLIPGGKSHPPTQEIDDKARTKVCRTIRIRLSLPELISDERSTRELLSITLVTILRAGHHHCRLEKSITQYPLHTHTRRKSQHPISGTVPSNQR